MRLFFLERGCCWFTTAAPARPRGFLNDAQLPSDKSSPFPDTQIFHVENINFQDCLVFAHFFLTFSSMKINSDFLCFLCPYCIQVCIVSPSVFFFFPFFLPGSHPGSHLTFHRVSLGLWGSDYGQAGAMSCLLGIVHHWAHFCFPVTLPLLLMGAVHAPGRFWSLILSSGLHSHLQVCSQASFPELLGLRSGNTCDSCWNLLGTLVGFN